MGTVLILHSSTEGQTARISEYIAGALKRQGLDARIASIRDAPELEGYAAVVVGASIHIGRYAPDLIDYLKQHSPRLGTLANAFFLVSLTASQQDEDSRKVVDGYLKMVVDDTGWQPNETVSFAGALRFSRYGFLKRQLMKWIARRNGLSTDASRDHELTDWNAVDEFANRLADRFARGPVPA